jgi:outer membrane lipoprotein-sorting protein
MRFITAVMGLFLLSAGMAGAQEDVFNYPLKAQTEASFQITCRRLAEHPFIRGNFEQEKTLSRLNRSLKSSGNFIIAAEQGMVWDTVNPFPSTLVLGRDFLIQSRPGGQRNVLSAKGNETFLRLADVISTIFLGNAKGLVNNFKVYYLDNASSWELGLTPLDRAINSFAQKIIMKGSEVIRSIEITEQNGDSIKYIMSNHSFPAELSNSEKALFTLP